jgi:hypothetical protein
MLLAFAGTLSAQTANQSVTVDVDAINVIDVSGNPGTLVINSATAGSAPDDASDNSTSYDITSNETTKKVVGSLDVAYASGISLKVTLASTGATSAGQVTLSTTDQDLVTGISNLAESGQQISYVASATVSAAPAAAESHTVTFTITS